jgi:hypothetical protein
MKQFILWLAKVFNVTVERVVIKEVVTELETEVEYLKNKDYALQ